MRLGKKKIGAMKGGRKVDCRRGGATSDWRGGKSGGHGGKGRQKKGGRRSKGKQPTKKKVRGRICVFAKGGPETRMPSRGKTGQGQVRKKL